MEPISEIEEQLDLAREQIKLRDMALKLYKNREFKKLILEEFSVNECARYAQASADPALDSDQRKDSLAIAQSAGHLRRFLSVLVQMGNVAENQLPEIRQAMDEEGEVIE